MPDVAMAGAYVVAVPAEKGPALLDSLGVDAEYRGAPDKAPGLLNRSSGLLDGRLFDHFDLTSTRSSPDGTYSLTIPPGSYWLCLAPTHMTNQGELPAQLDACSNAALQRGERKQVDQGWSGA